jgi:hypothetical protein
VTFAATTLDASAASSHNWHPGIDVGFVNDGRSVRNGCPAGRLPCVPHFHAKYPSICWRWAVDIAVVYSIVSLIMPLNPPLDGLEINVVPAVPFHGFEFTVEVGDVYATPFRYNIAVEVE